jgi:hypothetical protein
LPGLSSRPRIRRSPLRATPVATRAAIAITRPPYDLGLDRRPTAEVCEIPIEVEVRWIRDAHGERPAADGTCS